MKCKIEGILRLAFDNVGGKMELGYEKSKIGLLLLGYPHGGRVLPHSFPDVLAPLATYVVRYHNRQLLKTLDTREKHKVCIHVTGTKSVFEIEK